MKPEKTYEKTIGRLIVDASYKKPFLNLQAVIGNALKNVAVNKMGSTDALIAISDALNQETVWLINQLADIAKGFEGESTRVANDEDESGRND